MEFGGGFDRGGELEGLAPAELDFLDVRVADDVEFLLVNGLAVGVGDEFLFDFLVDVLFVAFGDHVTRGLARAEAGEAGVALKILERGIKGGIHVGGFDFDPDQFFAGSQFSTVTFTKQAFRLLPGRGY